MKIIKRVVTSTIILFLLLAAVYAYNTNNPTIFGHDASEISITIKGSQKILSQEISSIESRIQLLEKKIQDAINTTQNLGPLWQPP